MRNNCNEKQTFLLFETFSFNELKLFQSLKTCLYIITHNKLVESRVRTTNIARDNRHYYSNLSEIYIKKLIQI